MIRLEEINLFLFIILVVFLVYFVFKLIFWTLKSIGLQKIAKDHDIANSWLVWFPIADLYILGKVSDKIKKFWKIKNLGKLFVILSLIQVLFLVIYIITNAIVPVARYFISNDITEFISIATMAISIFGKFFKFLVEIIAGVIIVLRFIAIYQIYDEYLKDDLKIVFLIISLIIPFMQSIFLFTLRNKDISKEINNN